MNIGWELQSGSPSLGSSPGGMLVLDSSDIVGATDLGRDGVDNGSVGGGIVRGGEIGVGSSVGVGAEDVQLIRVSRQIANDSRITQL